VLLSTATASRYLASARLMSAVRVQLYKYTKEPPLLTHSLAFITKLQNNNTASSADSTSGLLAEGLRNRTRGLTDTLNLRIHKMNYLHFNCACSNCSIWSCCGFN